MGYQKVGYTMIKTAIYANEIIGDSAIVHVFHECLKASGCGNYIIRGIEQVVPVGDVVDYMLARLDGGKWNDMSFFTTSDLLTHIDEYNKTINGMDTLHMFIEMFGDEIADSVDDALYASFRMTEKWIEVVKYRFIELTF